MPAESSGPPRYRSLQNGVQPVALWGLAATGVTPAVARDLKTQWRRLAGQTLQIHRLTGEYWPVVAVKSARRAHVRRPSAVPLLELHGSASLCTMHGTYRAPEEFVASCGVRRMAATPRRDIAYDARQEG